MSAIVNQILQVAPLVIRVVVVGAGGLATIAGILNIFSPYGYTVFAVSLWSVVAGLAALACETSPEGFGSLLKVFPFLGWSL